MHVFDVSRVAYVTSHQSFRCLRVGACRAEGGGLQNSSAARKKINRELQVVSQIAETIERIVRKTGISIPTQSASWAWWIVQFSSRCVPGVRLGIILALSH